jgi:RimJ/RimL family protein N-acetyltransferase/anti-anti-sigma regulatory factor
LDSVVVGGELTERTAADFCALVSRRLAAPAATLLLDLQRIKVSDVVGLAALRQAARLGETRGIRTALACSDDLRRALLQAQVLEDFEVGVPAPNVESAVLLRESGDKVFSAATPRLALRRPTWDELALFDRWACDPLLEEMVGSQLLYRCRNLGAYHSEFVDLVFHDPRSLTLLVQPLDPGRDPVGFVRLYDIHLGQQFGFLETAMATMESLRRGWGIEASRLFLAYALDVLELHRIEAKVYAYNVLSANSLKRNGFREEGVLREARAYGGRRWDIVIFSILEREMREQRAGEQFPTMSLWSPQ